MDWSLFTWHFFLDDLLAKLQNGIDKASKYYLILAKNWMMNTYIMMMSTYIIINHVLPLDIFNRQFQVAPHLLLFILQWTETFPNDFNRPVLMEKLHEARRFCQNLDASCSRGCNRLIQMLDNRLTDVKTKKKVPKSETWEDVDFVSISIFSSYFSRWRNELLSKINFVFYLNGLRFIFFST